MGNVVRFRRRPRNRGQFRGQGDWQSGGKPKQPNRKLPDNVAFLLAAIALVSLTGLWWSVDAARAEARFTCQSVSVTYGDASDCDSKPIRMVGINAPELPLSYSYGEPVLGSAHCSCTLWAMIRRRCQYDGWAARQNIPLAIICL